MAAIVAKTSFSLCSERIRHMAISRPLYALMRSYTRIRNSGLLSLANAHNILIAQADDTPASCAPSLNKICSRSFASLWLFTGTPPSSEYCEDPSPSLLFDIDAVTPESFMLQQMDNPIACERKQNRCRTNANPPRAIFRIPPNNLIKCGIEHYPQNTPQKSTHYARHKYRPKCCFIYSHIKSPVALGRKRGRLFLIPDFHPTQHFTFSTASNCSNQSCINIISQI